MDERVVGRQRIPFFSLDQPVAQERAADGFDVHRILRLDVEHVALAIGAAQRIRIAAGVDVQHLVALRDLRDGQAGSGGNLACIIGEISSASCLTIAQVAQRNKVLYINTGGNSDALRGSDCKRYMFHVESQNSMYVKTVGRSFLRDGLVKGKKWYSLTADYAFVHDLFKVSKRFMEANGGNFAGDDLVPTDATDFSAYLLKIREAKPDLVVF